MDSYLLVLRLYDTPVGVATRAAREAPMPGRAIMLLRASCTMIRWLLWLLAGVAARRHRASRRGADAAAHRNAGCLFAAHPDRPGQYGRAAARSPTPQNALMPFMDPAFAAAVCRYDLANGPLKLTAPISPAYTSVSFYTRRGVAYYAINDRAAGRRHIELDLMTAAAARRIA